MYIRKLDKNQSKQYHPYHVKSTLCSRVRGMRKREEKAPKKNLKIEYRIWYEIYKNTQIECGPT